MAVEYTITPQLGHFTVISGSWYGFNRGKRGTNPKEFGQLNHPITWPQVEALVVSASDDRIIVDHSTDYNWGSWCDLYTGDNLEIYVRCYGEHEYITNGSYMGHSQTFVDYIKSHVGVAVPIDIKHGQY